MSDVRTILERGVAGAEPPAGGYERMLSRRDRRSRNRRIRAAVVGLAITLVVIFVGSSMIRSAPTPGTSPTPTPSTSDVFAQIHGWIVYREAGDLVAVDPADPTNRITLMSDSGLQPIGWSRDGSRMLGLRGFDVAKSQLFVVRPEGSEVLLTTQEEAASWGSISPAGTRVVYADLLGSGLFMVDASGGPRTLIAKQEPLERVNESPAWSPDGTRIALLDFRATFAFGLTVMNADGSGQVVQIENLGVGTDAEGLVWSPDGNRLAFFAYTDASTGKWYTPGPARIYVVDTETWEVQRLTSGGDNRWPTWSPDGSRIAFVRDGDLFTMAADGSGLQRVEGVHPAGAIAWNPGAAT